MNNFRGEYNVGAKNFHFMALPIEVAGGQRSKVLVGVILLYVSTPYGNFPTDEAYQFALKTKSQM